jgi:hypothetical protein
MGRGRFGERTLQAFSEVLLEVDAEWTEGKVCRGRETLRVFSVWKNSLKPQITISFLLNRPWAQAPL